MKTVQQLLFEIRAADTPVRKWLKREKKNPETTTLAGCSFICYNLLQVPDIRNTYVERPCAYCNSK